ncbi:DUF4277 domain-containing protein [Vibrio mimicus]
MSLSQPVIKRLDHLGLIAAFCHEICLPRIIDRVIPKHSEHNVSHGDAVLAHHNGCIVGSLQIPTKGRTWFSILKEP